MYDVIIIGAGPAGISAGLYAKRANLNVLILYKDHSALEKTEWIENYYGFEKGISGKDLYETGIQQAKNLGIEVKKEEVTNIQIGEGNQYIVMTEKETYDTKTVIFATGNKKNTPKIKGIKEFEGKGVSYCAVCDGFFYRNKDVSILGNGKYADIIVASTGSPKIINVGNGGFISTDNPDVLEKTRILQKIVKINKITASGVCVELENIDKKLNTTINACNYLKNNLDDVIHANKRGLNVIIKDAKPKDFSWNLKKELETDKKGFITKCPNYNRIKEKAVTIEIKNLDYNCLKREYLDKIIEVKEKNKTENQ